MKCQRANLPLLRTTLGIAFYVTMHVVGMMAHQSFPQSPRLTELIFRRFTLSSILLESYMGRYLRAVVYAVNGFSVDGFVRFCHRTR